MSPPAAKKVAPIISAPVLPVLDAPPAPDPADVASEDVERHVLRSLGAFEARRLQ